MADWKERDEIGYYAWRRWMELGEKTGCHQRPDRSFYIRGYQMPVCARCNGVMIGYMIAVVSYFKLGFLKAISMGGCIAMLTDWLVQAMGIHKSTNNRRLITGILGGFGIMSLQLYFIKQMISWIQKAR